MSKQFYQLSVSNISKATKDAVSVSFDVPKHLYDTFNYHPGQHLTIQFLVNGTTARRSYSLNSCPFTAENLQVSIKKVKGGLVSNYANEHLKVGDVLNVMPPSGRFYANIEADAYKSYFLFAAGSGITPIMSILRSVLVASPHSVVKLFYGNAHQDSIIFKDKLADLQKKYSTRLQVVHTLSSPKVWSTWEQWKGRKGRIDSEAVEWFINQHPPIAQSTEYYICGPGAMNTSIRETLIGLQIPKELIFIEQFGGPVSKSSEEIEAFENAQLSVHLNGQTHQLVIPKGKTILQVLKEANIDAPYACESGVCGTCMAKKLSGKIAMKSSMALDDADIKNNLILTCQALTLSEQVAIKF